MRKLSTVLTTQPSSTWSSVKSGPFTDLQSVTVEEVMDVLPLESQLLTARYADIHDLLRAAIVERVIHNEPRIKNLCEIVGKTVQSRREVASLNSRRALMIAAIKADPQTFRRRLLAKATLRSFDELRLDSVRRRRTSLAALVFTF